MVTSSNESRKWLSRAAKRVETIRSHGALRASARGAARLGIACGVALTLVAGCSSTSPKGTVDKFVGVWTFDSGSLMATCPPPLPPFNSDLVGQTLTLEKGTTSDLVSTLQSMLGTCTLKLTVDGTVASADAGQTCMFNATVAGTTVPVKVNVATWTVTSSNGTSMTTAATGTVTEGLAAGCAITLGGAATKHATTDASAG